MQQRTLIIDDSRDFQGAFAGIAGEPAFQEACDRLLVVFEPDCDPATFAPKASQLSEALPGTHICGMTTLGSTEENIAMPEKTACTLLLLQESNVHVCSYDCHEMSPMEAGERFIEELAGIEHVRGVLVMTSCASLQPGPFVDIVSQRYPYVPLFGAQAGTSRLDQDQSMILADGAVLDRGIVAVVFSGESLQVSADYNMGFRPIGRTFSITGNGERGVVKSIDGSPAQALYERYLGVTPDDYFYENVCAFPLIERRKSRDVPRVPLRCTDGGGLLFSMEMDEGTEVTLAYSRPEYLLRESLESANHMAQFAPEALLAFACMNRRIFMGNEDADRELSYYRQVNRNICWAYGYGEILSTSEGGGILNSTLIAVGLREGSVSGLPTSAIFDSDIYEQRTGAIPLTDRLVAFLEATSAELRSTIDSLSDKAQRDPLTGLFNRRYMDDYLNYVLEKLGDKGEVVLMMFDIDHFKSINDTYGHEIGDQVLKELVACVEENIRANDILSRWGGEEFLLLFARAQSDLAFSLADRIREHIERHIFRTVGKVTVSVGVTVGTGDDTLDSLFKRVDEALYEAKNGGRNRTCMH